MAERPGLDRGSVFSAFRSTEGGTGDAPCDAPGRGRCPETTDEEKAWIINIACRSPVSFGYPAPTRGSRLSRTESIFGKLTKSF